jgi:hypothetical protein
MLPPGGFGRPVFLPPDAARGAGRISPGYSRLHCAFGFGILPVVRSSKEMR